MKILVLETVSRIQRHEGIGLTTINKRPGWVLGEKIANCQLADQLKYTGEEYQEQKINVCW